MIAAISLHALLVWAGPIWVVSCLAFLVALGIFYWAERVWASRRHRRYDSAS